MGDNWWPLGQKLRTIRTGNNLTQKDLATIFKVSESAIGMYERDEREPSFKFINDVADRFEVTTDYLLGRTSDADQGTSKVLSKRVKEFLSAVELSDDAIREIISYARYKANQE
jgi:transcriptional regulator with XRE-family HTH domain